MVKEVSLLESQASNRAIWFKALREDGYEQGFTGDLKKVKEDGSVCWCALGVANEVLRHGVQTYQDLIPILGIKPRTNFIDEDADGIRNIYILNDNKRLTFPQIADELENNPTDYFEV